ncbi:hypothetical protein ABIE13_004116 [Ottowia thiooxydans]|uniref:Uncharacterized protein n=1 Tax=Ottowia thiooxydans TaxID=219182 RepID=A0ABV2QD80_9BURK
MIHARTHARFEQRCSYLAETGGCVWIEQRTGYFLKKFVLQYPFGLSLSKPCAELLPLIKLKRGCAQNERRPDSIPAKWLGHSQQGSSPNS